MNHRPLRILLTVNTAVFLLIGAVFLVHHLGPALFPGNLEDRLSDNQWLMWTSTGIATLSALAVPLLIPFTTPAEEER